MMKSGWFSEERFASTSVVFLATIGVVALLHTKASNLLIIVYACMWLVYQFKSWRQPQFWQYTFVFIFCGYYALGIAGIFYSDNKPEAFHWLEAKLPFLAFPILVTFAPLSAQHINRILTVFSFALIGIGLILFVFSTRDYLSSNEIEAFTYTRFHELFDIHPTYFSFFASFGVFHLYARREMIARNRKEKAFLFAAIAALILLIFLSLSRTGILAFLLVFGAFFFYKLFAGKARSLSYWVFFIVLIALVVITIPLVKERFELFIISDPLGKETFNSTAFHIKSWYCSLESLANFHLFTGYGTGDEKDVLVVCYKKYDWVLMAEERHNAHNEYLSVMLRHGVAGLAVLLIMIAYPALMAFRHKEFVYAGFLAIFAIMCLSGSLNLYHGVVFYCLFNALLFRRTMLRADVSSDPGGQAG